MERSPKKTIDAGRNFDNALTGFAKILSKQEKTLLGGGYSDFNIFPSLSINWISRQAFDIISHNFEGYIGWVRGYTGVFLVFC